MMYFFVLWSACVVEEGVFRYCFCNPNKFIYDLIDVQFGSHLKPNLLPKMNLYMHYVILGYFKGTNIFLSKITVIESLCTVLEKLIVVLTTHFFFHFFPPYTLISYL
jgi:hypothetical protein